jgi:hypothetical protein
MFRIPAGGTRSEALFTLLAERYERGSVTLATNLPFSEREQIFKNPMTTVAAIDRLVRHCVILERNVKSCRMEQAGRGIRRRPRTEAKATEGGPRQPFDYPTPMGVRLGGISPKAKPSSPWREDLSMKATQRKPGIKKGAVVLDLGWALKA